MNVLLALAIVIGLVAATTVGGLVLRSRTGRVSDARATVVHAAELPSPAAFGSEATLLQFSTEFCSPCRATHRLLGRLAEARPGVAHLDVDLSEHPELATRFHILQTPTTFILDSSGTVQARIGGAPRSDELVKRLDNLIGHTHVAA
ncbi:MAG TPA: thioredoxin family protein [Microbacteriaceae bacterium]